LNPFLRGAGAGALCGVAGAAVLAGTSKLEQLATRRPDSYVPAHTLANLLGLSDPDADRWVRNMAMHYASGAAAGSRRRGSLDRLARGHFYRHG
jgi:hypothetical protein